MRIRGGNRKHMFGLDFMWKWRYMIYGFYSGISYLFSIRISNGSLHPISARNLRIITLRRLHKQV